MLARPHQLELSKHPTGRPSFPARVTWLHTAGAQVRVELDSQFGKVLAELSHARCRELALAPGCDVLVSLTDFQVFPDDDAPALRAV